MIETPEYTRPLPLPGPDDVLFWEGCRRHELLLQKCSDCGLLRFWEMPMCPTCNSLESEAVPSSGRGTIWSYTTTYQAFAAPWKGTVPYTVVVVALEEGPWLTSMLVAGTPQAAIAIGAPVEVVFEDVTLDATLPKFRLVT